MSIEAVSYVLNHVAISGNAKVLMIGLANHAHPDGTSCHPAIETLARYAAVNRSTVQRNLRQLEADGHIEQTGVTSTGRRVYRIVGLQNAAPVESGGRNGDAQGPHQERLGAAPVPPEPSIGTVKGTVDAARARDPRDEVPGDFPDELRPHAREVLKILRDVAVQHGAPEPRVRSVARAMMGRPRKPLVRAAHDFASWAADPPRPIRDVVSSYRTWLDRERDLAAVERLPGGGAGTNGAARRFKRTAPVEMQTDPKGEHGRQRA